MARETTLPAKWDRLAEAYGGVGKLADQIGVSTSTLFRLARGEITATFDHRKRVIALSAVMKLQSPLSAPPVVTRPVDRLDLRILALIGQQVETRRTKVPQDLVASLVSHMTQTALIQLAESDRPSDMDEETWSYVLRAASILLGL